MSNTKKHSILAALKSKQDKGEEESGYGHYVTELGRTLSNIQLHEATKLAIKEIDDLCNTMISKGHIAIYKTDDDNKAHRVIITPSGIQAYIDKEYLSQIWYRKASLIIPSISLLISLSAVLLPLIWNPAVNRLEKRIDGIEKRLELLEKQLHKSTSS